MASIGGGVPFRAFTPGLFPGALTMEGCGETPGAPTTSGIGASGIGASGIGAPQDGVTLSSFGQRLAQSTLDCASENTNLKRFRCFHFVKDGLEAEGVNLQGKSAYQAAPQLARNPNFKEAKFTRDQLSELPAGAVVVWNKSAKHKNGHISVALGDGREVSDRIRPQIENYQSAYRVFLPNDGSPTRQAGIPKPATPNG